MLDKAGAFLIQRVILVKRHELTVILWLAIMTNNWLWTTDLSLLVKWLCLGGCLGVVTWWLARRLELRTRQSVVKLIVLIIINWILILPLGGLGLTSYLLMALPVPDLGLQFIYLHRLLLGIIAVLTYLVLLGSWWSVQPVTLHWLQPTKLARASLSRRRSFSIWLMESLGLGLIATGGIFLNNRSGAVILVAAGTLFAANTTSWLLVRYLRIDQVGTLKPCFTGCLAAICLGCTICWMVVQPSFPRSSTIPLIAHRGVDGHNGVQNTLQSLKKTSNRAKRMEMDIQETKDHRFVCLHDPNLAHLAHRNILVKDHRLSRLMQVHVREHGQETKLTSFDAYLKAARRLHVKLIVEIKPQAGVNSRQSAREFVRRYRHAWQTDQFAVHSVDDAIIEELGQHVKHQQLGLIRPFIISRLKTTGVDFYSIDYRAVNRAYVNYLHDHHVKVYAWTVDRPVAAKRMVAAGVDGIITDDTSLVKTHLAHVTNGIMYQAENFLWQII